MMFRPLLAAAVMAGAGLAATSPAGAASPVLLYVGSATLAFDPTVDPAVPGAPESVFREIQTSVDVASAPKTGEVQLTCTKPARCTVVGLNLLLRESARSDRVVEVAGAPLELPVQGSTAVTVGDTSPCGPHTVSVDTALTTAGRARANRRFPGTVSGTVTVTAPRVVAPGDPPYVCGGFTATFSLDRVKPL